MGNSDPGTEPDPAPPVKKKDMGAIALVVIMCFGCFMVGFTMKGCENGDEPGPPPPASAKRTADEALTTFGKALVEICNETADKQESGDLRDKNAVVKFFDEELYTRRQAAFTPVGELLQQDYSPKTFRLLAKGFDDALD